MARLSLPCWTPRCFSRCVLLTPPRDVARRFARARGATARCTHLPVAVCSFVSRAWPSLSSCLFVRLLL
eukprot:11164260-Alexandrium_andersonii.AAC.1